MAASIFKNDIGTILEATIKDENNAIVDISTATLLKFKLKKPTALVVEKTAILSGGGTDGKLRYITIANDLDVDGEWIIQAYVEIGASTKFHTDTSSFIVKLPLS